MFQNSVLRENEGEFEEEEEEDVVIETESTITSVTSPHLPAYPLQPTAPGLPLYHSLYPPAASIQGYVLLLHNVHPEAREEDLRDLLLDFVRPLMELRVPTEHRTGMAKGYALVEVKEREAAEKVKHALNGYTFMGRRLMVDYCFIQNTLKIK